MAGKIFFLINSKTHLFIERKSIGIPIEDSYYSAHYSKDGDLMHVVGKYDANEIPKDKIEPRISESEAFQIASNDFMIEDKNPLPDYRKIVSDELTNKYNRGEIEPQLVYFRTENSKRLLLSYRIDITSESAHKFLTFYVDAATGVLLQRIDHRAYNVATVQTAYNGSQTVGVEWRGWPSSYYYLRMEGYSTPFETRNSSIRYGYPYCTPWGFGNLDLVYKGNLDWPLDFKLNAASSHWAVKESYTVFKNIFGRIYGTFSSSGGEIRMENNYVSQYPADGPAGPFYQAGGSYDYIHVGQTIGNYNGFEGSLDVIAHEFTHGVQYRARGVDGSVYFSPSNEEAGALCESFSDIFGVLVEYYTTGSTDYIVGSNLQDYFKRSLQNPRSYPLYGFTPQNDNNCVYQVTNLSSVTVPLYFHEYPYWIFGYGSGPAHINNAVQNYWFYMLANGGSQLGINVTGIGLTNAGRIAYRNMVYYFSKNSDFDDMRQASIVNAAALYGECSNEYTQVMNAWAAVGVGTSGTPCLHTEIYGLESLMCGEEGYYAANVYGGSGNYTYNWYVDYNYYSSASSLYLSFYPQYEGEYHYIYLEVSDGSLSDSDDYSVYVYQCGQGGLQSTETLKFNMYPNPATTSTRVEIEDNITQDPSQYSIQIFDRNGRLVYSDKSYKTDFIINTSSFQKGVYSTIIKKGKKVGSTNLIIQ